MSFWRKEVIQPALDNETRKHVEEQVAWIVREPGNPHPYYNLAQLYRMEGRQEDALGLLLEAVRLDDEHADAHAALAEMYAVMEDYPAAARHALAAEKAGNSRPAAMLRRYGVS